MTTSATLKYAQETFVFTCHDLLLVSSHNRVLHQLICFMYSFGGKSNCLKTESPQSFSLCASFLLDKWTHFYVRPTSPFSPFQQHVHIHVTRYIWNITEGNPHVLFCLAIPEFRLSLRLSGNVSSENNKPLTGASLTRSSNANHLSHPSGLKSLQFITLARS